jgi:septal ring factor EnvC (AmiA/AmiB activator)
MYGRLAEISVERGDGVDEGQKLGKSSQPDLNGSNFYFEIRVDGKPTDPQRYLASAYSPKGGPKVKAIR